MTTHIIGVESPRNRIPKEAQLAYRIAQAAVGGPEVRREVADMVVNRVIDNAAVAVAALRRRPVRVARAMALAHPRESGATVFGLDSGRLFDAEWAAWANGAAVRELDFHDTFLAADYIHPGDTISPLIAVAQQTGRSGRALVSGITAAYEIQIALAKSIPLHEFGIDHLAHLCPATAAGIGTLLDLDTETIYQAVNQAVHTSFTTRQSRRGEISSWKAYVPAHSALLAIVAVDRALRGETSPSPVYEGVQGAIACMLGGTDARYHVELPEPGEERSAILESYTKEHSAEYQAQAVIDLAFRLRNKIADAGKIESVVIRTSRHTHMVIGTGSGDPQKFDPDATRETLDHSVMYIFAVAFLDGSWHHESSYSAERRHDAELAMLWRKVRTEVDNKWEYRYHDPDPAKRAFGATIEITLGGGQVIRDELAVADAHPNGAHPFNRSDYIGKFEKLTSTMVGPDEAGRFLSAAERLSGLSPGGLAGLNIAVPADLLDDNPPMPEGIF